MRLLALFAFLLTASLDARDYCLYKQRAEKPEISEFCLFAERCSGSNYTHQLIHCNIVFPRFWVHRFPYYHKHFPPWFEIPVEEYPGPTKFATMEGCEHSLIVVVFRNPYDWLRSIHKSPYCTLLGGMSFSNFIRSPWIRNENDGYIKGGARFNPWIELDPVTRDYFENVMKLRTAKIRTMLEMQNRVDNICFVNYETARDYPEEVIKEIAAYYNLERKGEFDPIVNYKGNKNAAPYKPKQYRVISEEDLLWINSQLDKELEYFIGYDLVEDPSVL